MRVQVFGAGLVLAACSLPLAADVEAQAPAPAAASVSTQAEETHFQISVMEGVLRAAAENGARQTSQKLTSLLPEPLLWNGASRARGFRLENYGFFFDVEVPELRGSVAWSLQVLDRSPTLLEAELVSSLQALQQQIRSAVADRQVRAQMDEAVRRIQVQIAGDEARPDPARPHQVGTVAPRPARPPIDPNETYTNDVKTALVDAMLDHGGPLKLEADEWLTVAARASESGGVAAPQPYDLMTLILRIRGSDLAATQAALHSGKLTKDEARKKVEVKEF